MYLEWTQPLLAKMKVKEEKSPLGLLSRRLYLFDLKPPVNKTQHALAFDLYTTYESHGKQVELKAFPKESLGRFAFKLMKIKY